MSRRAFQAAARLALAGLLAALPALAPLALGDASLASLARADEEDKLAPIREEVVKLEAEGRFESALALLRGTKEETLDPGSQLERAQRIDSLTTRQLEKYADDRTKAAALEKQGKHAEAAAALADVERYGNAKQIAEAKADRARLEETAKKSDASKAEETKKKASEDAKKKAVDSAADRANATKVVKKWLDARRQLVCSTCSGAKLLMCQKCEGVGKIKIIHAAPAPGYAPSYSYEDCGRCKTTGKVKCSAESCKGSGVNGYKARQAVWDPLPKAFKGDLEKKGLNEKRFVDGIRAALQGEEAAPEVEWCIALVDGILEPIKSYDTFEIAIGDDGVAIEKYFVKRGLKSGTGMEESRWGKYDGVWCLVPPSLEAPPPVKKKPAKPGKPGKEPPPEEPMDPPPEGEKGE